MTPPFFQVCLAITLFICVVKLYVLLATYNLHNLYQYIRTYCVIYVPVSRLTIVSREAKKKQAVRATNK